MIQQETRLVVADNSGAKEILCIRVYREKVPRKYGNLVRTSTFRCDFCF